MIEAFAKLLVRAELNPTLENLADIFWLARVLPAPLPPAPPPEKPPLPEAEAAVPGIPPAAERAETAGPEKPAAGEPTHPTVPPGELYPRVVARSQPQETRKASPIRVPATKALPNALEIGRALRPLSRRYPSRRLFVMDDEATAERIAEGGPMTPVMRPLNERWFEADVVVDGSPSMVVWHRVVREFLDLLAQHGAFADVRRWTLSRTETGAVLRSPSGVPRRPGELKDPASRRLIFVLTDGVGEAWREDGMPRVLATWARTTPVVIVQMLPERLWPLTAIGVPSAEVWSPVPGVANGAMMVQRPWWDQDGAAAVIPIVPITLEASSIQRWAVVLMGAALTAPAIMFGADGADAQPAVGAPAADVAGALSAEERVQQFRAMVSREAYDLAVFLSAVPLTLPVIGLLQRELLPESRQVHLAEVFVGGIVERLTAEDIVCDPDQIEFEFADGVRDILQDSLRRSEAVDVLVVISKYVEKHFGQALDFGALIADPEGAVALPEAVRPFARIGMQTYQRFLGHVRLPSVPGPAERDRPLPAAILINVPPPPEVFVDREAERKAALEALVLPPPAPLAEQGEGPLRVFVSYARKDEQLFVELQTVIKTLRERHRIEVFDQGRIRAGEDWSRRLQEELQRSDIFLLLVSPEWLASEWSRGEMEASMRRSADGSALVIPIIAEECDWRSTPLAKLQALPTDGRALGASSDATTRTMRWLQLHEDLEKAITGWREAKQRRQAAAQAPRVVALIGPEGIGKFTLARRLVHEPGVRERYPDGILWLGEDGQGYPRQWLRAYCEAVGISAPFNARNIVDERKFGELFAARRVLFIADQRSASDMLPTLIDRAGPSCTVLVLGAGAPSVPVTYQGEIVTHEGETVTYTPPASLIAHPSLSLDTSQELLRALGAPADLPEDLVTFAVGNPLLLRLLAFAAKIASQEYLAKTVPEHFAASDPKNNEIDRRVAALLSWPWGQLMGPASSPGGREHVRVFSLLRASSSVSRLHFPGSGIHGDQARHTFVRIGLLEPLGTEVRLHPVLRRALKWEVPDFAVFRDIDAPWCPEMVVIPAGEFLMGSPDSEKERDSDEGPQHRVTIGQRFALGRTPVTVGEYRKFVEVSGHRHEGGMRVWTGSEWKEDATRSWQDPGFAQAEQHPVVGVNWRDAVAYCEWLAKETGQRYRLPTEAEWEYAARAGKKTRYSVGDEISEKDANFGAKVGKTTEVSACPPNPWGLYDVHGNVWEWVEDIWHDSYQGAPADGSAWVEREGKDSSCARVVRGGSWVSDPRSCRSALRDRYRPEDRYDVRGFRVARTLS